MLRCSLQCKSFENIFYHNFYQLLRDHTSYNPKQQITAFGATQREAILGQF